jgi:hypothetical protein
VRARGVCVCCVSQCDVSSFIQVSDPSLTIDSLAMEVHACARVCVLDGMHVYAQYRLKSINYKVGVVLVRSGQVRVSCDVRASLCAVVVCMCVLS